MFTQFISGTSAPFFCLPLTTLLHNNENRNRKCERKESSIVDEEADQEAAKIVSVE